MKAAGAALVLPLLLLAGCDDRGMPSTDTEVWALVIVLLGTMATISFCWWVLNQ